MQFPVIVEPTDQFEHLHEVVMARTHWAFFAEGRRAGKRLDRAGRAVLGVNTPAAKASKCGTFPCVDRRSGFLWRAFWLTVPKSEVPAEAFARMVRLLGSATEPGTDRDVCIVSEGAQDLINGFIGDVERGTMRFVSVDHRNN